MPIEGMKERRQFKKIGSIYRGTRVPVEDEHGVVKMKDGEPVTKPKPLDHFVVPEEVAALHGEKPTVLPINFLMDDNDDVFPHFLMRYAKNGDVVCMSNGRRVEFRRHIGEKRKGKKREVVTLIYGGVAQWKKIEGKVGKLWEGGGGYGTLEKEGNSIHCLHFDCPQFKHEKRYCKPTGMLRFAVKGIIRQGYYQLTVHLNALPQILGQLQHGREFIQQYLGRATILHAEWVLELTGPEKKWVGDWLLDVWTPELELDRDWMKLVVEGKVKLPHMPAPVTADDVYGAPPEEEDAPLDADLLEPLRYNPNGEDDEPPAEEELPF